MGDKERELLWARWLELKKACHAQHKQEMKGRAGGAVVCICGHGCGGCGACGMLAEIVSLVRYLPAESLPAEWRDRIEMYRGVMC